MQSVKVIGLLPQKIFNQKENTSDFSFHFHCRLVERRGNYLNNLNTGTPIHTEEESEPLIGNIESENNLVTSDAMKALRPQLRYTVVA